MATGIGGMGGVIAALTGTVLTSVEASARMDRCAQAGDVVDRYGVRRALSGVLFGAVDVVSGAALRLPERETDFALRGRLPLRWSRFYSSALPEPGLFGPGWRTRWEVTLRVVADRLIYTDESGREIAVPCPERGSLAIVGPEQLHIAHLADGRFVVADLAPLYRVFGDFDANGVARLKYVEDLQRQRIGCLWSADGRLTRLRGTCGHELLMHYEGHAGTRLSAVECVDGGPTGLFVQYGYSERGELAEVRNRNGELVRRYVADGARIVEETNALGLVTSWRWQTVGDVARVVERSVADGAHERFTYDTDNWTSEVTDAFGDTATWRYDERRRIVSHTGFDGRSYRFDYADGDGPTTLTLPGGGVVRLEYDTLGRVVKETDPLGRTRTTQYAYASREPMAISTDDGRTWRWNRNDALQPTQYQLPSGALERIEYGADGLPLRCTDAQGVVTACEYNAWGQPLRRVEVGEFATQYEYDDDGYLTRVTDAGGGLTRIEYDLAGRPLIVVRPDGKTERHAWNAAGQRISFIGAGGQRLQWNRDGRGHVVGAVDEEGHTTTIDYDAHGRPTRIESGNGGVQQLEWRAAGCASITDADGVIRVFDYDDAGNLERVTTKAGSLQREETYSYDAMGRPVSRHTLHNQYDYAYSVQGPLEKIVRTPTQAGEQLGIGADEVRLEYDSDGRLVAEHGANGELRYTLNPLGRVVALTLPNRQVLFTRRYVSGDIALMELDGREIVRFWYDGMHRLTARRLGEMTVHTGYTPTGKPLWWRSITGEATEPTERDLQLWFETDYNPADQVSTTYGPGYGRVYYDYDRRGCLLRRVSDALGVEYFMWDAASNLLEAPGAGWAPAVSPDHRIRECRGYSYEYDAWGQLVERSGRDHAMSLEWDAEGHLLAVRRRGCTVRYEYDALGRRIVKRVEAATGGAALRTAPGQQDVTRFLWQGLRLLQEQRAERRRLYLYLPGGRDERSHTPLVAIDEALSETGEVKETQTCHYHTDTAGTAIAVSDGNGDVVWRGQYYAWGHPVTAVAVDGQELAASRVFQPLRYAGQYADDETTLCHNGSRYYDPGTGRYVSPDRSGPAGVSPYRYAPNPLTWCNPTGTPVPQQSFGTAAGGLSAGLDRALDPAQQLAGIVEQFHGVAGWNPLERADEHGLEI